MNTHGFESNPPEQLVPVTFHPAKLQFGLGIAVTFIVSPMVSEHPEGHDGSVRPSPTSVVVRVEQALPVQAIVTVSFGADFTKPPEVPVTVRTYWVPGVALRAATTNVVTNVG